MKNFLLSILVFSTVSLYAQYCLFFDLKVDEPQMVVSALTEVIKDINIIIRNFKNFIYGY